MRVCRWVALIASALVATPPCAAVSALQDQAEVRQLVSFKFLAGQEAEAERIYLESLVPAYAETPAIRRFRGYREAESPVPLDLLVVTSLRGLAGMDELNAQLRARESAGRPAIGPLYGRLGALSLFHHDAFVEMVSLAADVSPAPRLWALEWVRTTAGSRETYLRTLTTTVEPWERAQRLVRTTETARVVVGDGWDVLRWIGFDTLGEYHAHLMAARRQPVAARLDALVAARRTQIVRDDPRFSVR